MKARRSFMAHAAVLCGIGWALIAHADEPGDEHENALDESALGPPLRSFATRDRRERFRRLTVEASDAGMLSAVGMVVCEKEIGNRTERSRGTGTVVGSRSTVLTVAHNLITQSRRWRGAVEFEAADCLFRRYDASGEETIEVAFTAAAFGAYKTNSGLPNEDWAVLRTAEPLPETVQVLSFEAVDSNALESNGPLPIAVLAFHLDWERRSRALLLTEGTLFEVYYAGLERLAHTADTESMSSGAAIVRRTNDGSRIVLGVHRSAARLDDFNLAVPVSGELESTLRRYASGGDFIIDGGGK